MVAPGRDCNFKNPDSPFDPENSKVMWTLLEKGSGSESMIVQKLVRIDHFRP